MEVRLGDAGEIVVRSPHLFAGYWGDEEATRGYLDQVSCTNRKVSALVDTILTRSRRPSVILLQSDHGHGRIGRIPALKYVKPDQVKERMAAFAAYLVPTLEAKRITDSITPVNVMRLVLSHYFGADLPLLEDASYWSSEDRPLDFVRIEWSDVSVRTHDSYQAPTSGTGK
jgi:acyl-CoA synthetase (AMP-forming)/AMP-acid ligase II